MRHGIQGTDVGEHQIDVAPMVDDARQRLVDIPDIEGFEIIHLLTAANAQPLAQPQSTSRFEFAL